MNELSKSEYPRIIPFLKQVNFNYLFAKSVLENDIEGKVYVDCVNTPSNFYILHSYGMSLLFGNGNNAAFNFWLRDYLLNSKKKRTQVEWLQVYPEIWNRELDALLGDELIRKGHTKELIDENVSNRVIENTRVNFKFNYDAYRSFRQNIKLEDYNIVKTDKQLFEEMNGAVVPKAFWKSAEEFLQSGVGFSILINQKLATTAYSAFIHDKQLELGIETIPGYKGNGLASVCCAVLIDYCISNDFEPVWSCKLENIPSYKLAQKLGFEPISYRPYYMVRV